MCTILRETILQNCFISKAQNTTMITALKFYRVGLSFCFVLTDKTCLFFQLVSLKLIFKYGGFRSSTNTSNAALFQLKVVDRAIMPGDAVRRTKFKNNGEYTPQRGFVKKVGSFQSPPPKFLKVNFPKKFRPV